MSAFAMLIAIIFFMLGFAGTLLPLLPGAPLIWTGMFIYGILTGFAAVGWKFLVLQGIAVAVIMLVDYAAGAWGVDRYGGSKSAVTGSIIGGLAGVIFLGPIGLILGPFLGAVIPEVLKGRPWERALKVGWGTIVGFLGGTVLKLVLEVLMVIWFLMQIF